MRRWLGYGAGAAQGGAAHRTPPGWPPAPPLGEEFWRVEEKVWRKHWWLLVRAIYGPVGIVTLLCVAAWLWQQVVPADWTPPALVAAFVLILLVLLGKVAWEIVDWRNDTYILTDSHVIDVQRKPLFGGRKRREIRLDRIQTVSVEQPSRLQVILNFGTVVVEAAGNRPEFWHGLPNPYGVREAILEAEERYLARQAEEMRQRTRQETLEAVFAWVEGAH